MFTSPVPVVPFRMGGAYPGAALRPVPLLSGYRLSEGRMSAPAVSSSALSALQKNISTIMDALGTEIQAVTEEFNLSSPAALRVDPTSAQQISYIGQFDPREIRSAILEAASSLSDLAGRVLSGSLSGYLGSDQRSSLLQLKSQADQVVAALRNEDTLPIAPGDQDVVQSYIQMHVGDPTSMVETGEKGVVAAEAGASAGAIPVVEPMEKNSSKVIYIATGVAILSAVGLVLWHVLG